MKKKYLSLVLLASLGLLLASCNQSGQGEPGKDGISIVSIAKTSSEGNVDTYTIKYSDGRYSTFTVTNGEDGQQGIQGVPGEDGHTPTITIGQNGHWYIDGVDTGIPAQGPQGQQGEQGVSIVSITKTSTVGNVDTYTILYSNGKTTTFTVTNGENGQQGIQGVPGEDGHTPTITVGANGHWFIDGVDTGISAQGPQGEQGVSIVSITKTSSDGNVDTYTILYSNGTTSTFTVTNGQDGHDGNSPYIGPNGNWWVGDVDTGVFAGEDLTEPEYEFKDFQEALDHSEPTKVVTNQTFKLDEEDLILHYNSNLTIEYGGEVKTKYDYTYEKLNEITTGNESFLTTVSNTLYSKGTGVYDGVQWINKVEGATTMNGVDLSKASNTALDHNVLTGEVENSKIRDFFGVNYDIKDLSMVICLRKYKIASVKLTFKAHIDCIDEDAEVTSYTTFSYDKLTVNIPY